MGLKTEWKAVLDDAFGYCRLDGVPDGTVIDVVIDDGSLAVRRTVHAIDSWAQLGRQLRTRIASFFGPSLQRYVITFDEKRHVPSCKQPEQEKRVAASLAQGITPLSGADLANLRIDCRYPVPEPKAQFIKRLMITPGAQTQFLEFCTAEIASVQILGAASPSPPSSLPAHSLPGSTDMETEAPDLYSDASASVGVHMVVDGGRIAMLDERRKNNESDARFLLESAEYLSREPTCIYVLPGERPCIRVEPSSGIGEGDLKIVKHISMLEGGNVYIRSCDTDMIVILLLNMRRWISQETGCARHGIFLDMTSNAAAAAAGKNLLDVVSLWRSILTHFCRRYPGIPCPIETVCLLMLISGGDYADGFSQLGPRRLWSAFCDGGHSILFEGSESYRMLPVRDPQDQSQHDPNTQFQAIHTKGRCDYGADKQRYSLTFNEDRILRFITYAYHKCLSLPISQRAALSMDSVRRFVQQKAPNARARWKLIPDGEMRAVVRRIWWWMDYLINGALEKRCNPFLDPTVTHHDTGLSLHGWEQAGYDPEKKRMRVRTAKEVHVNRPRVEK